MFILMVVVFVLGYLMIALEHPLKIDKAATALLLGATMWLLLVIGKGEIFSRTNEDGTLSNTAWAEHIVAHPEDNAPEGLANYIIADQSLHHLGSTCEVIFFLLGAMTIVAIMDNHRAFEIITDRIHTRNKRKLLCMLTSLTFFMSAVLDNLTTTIVMVTLLNKLVSDKHLRWVYAGMVVLAANAGGAWSPIGDVTTIMLWIGGQITALPIIESIFLPSLVSIAIPLAVLCTTLKGDLEPTDANVNGGTIINRKLQTFTLYWGLISLLTVPVLKTFLHIPPYLGMLLMLGIFWIITDVIHKKNPTPESTDLTVSSIMTRVDTPTVLFFLGILTAVAALQTSGHLAVMSEFLDSTFGNVTAICTSIGIISSVVDNVPLVAGAMGMYEVASPDAVGMAADFVQDGTFWSLLAFCAGTGGSILIIGSAAGVAAMSLEKIDFIWYLKHISWLALLGYFAGIGVFLLQHQIMA